MTRDEETSVRRRAQEPGKAPPIDHLTVVSASTPSTTTAVGALWSARGLVGALTRRDLQGKYRGSLLGIGWALVRPIALLFVYGVVVGGFLGAGRTIPDFALLLFTGLIAWTFFSGAAQSGATAVTGNAPLVKKVAFPREVLPLVTVFVAGVNTLLMLPILLLGYLLAGDWPEPADLPILVPATLSLFLLSLATALLLAAVNVFSRDIEHLVDIMLLLLFWASPVVYPWTFAVDFFRSHGLTWLETLYLANPLTRCVIAFQNALWPGVNTAEGSSLRFYEGVWSSSVWLLPLVALALTWLAYRLFLRLQGTFAQEL